MIISLNKNTFKNNRFSCNITKLLSKIKYILIIKIPDCHALPKIVIDKNEEN